MIIPVNSRVLVEIIKEENIDALGGLEVAGERTRKDRPLKGKVLTVAQSLEDYKVKEGGTILFSPYGYDELVEEGKTLALVPYDLIIGIWES